MSKSRKKTLKPSEQNGEKLNLATNAKHEMVLSNLKPPYEITIDLQIDPEDLEHCRDEFTLYSTDENQTYRQTKSIRDDRVEGDEQLTLTFTELDPNLSYTLEIYQGSSAPLYNLFEDVPYSDLKKAEEEPGYLDPDETEEPEEEEDEDEEMEYVTGSDLSDEEIQEIYDETVEEEGLEKI